MSTKERAFTVTRGWRYIGYEGGIEDSVILIDGQQVGGCYHCADATWASYGPAAYSFGHPTREEAEEVQVRQYLTDPDHYDRLNAEYRAEQEAAGQHDDAMALAKLLRWCDQRFTGRVCGFWEITAKRS